MVCCTSYGGLRLQTLLPLPGSLPLSLSPPLFFLSRRFDTDNGAFYYYNPEKNKTYEDTLMDVYDYETRGGERHQQCVCCVMYACVCANVY